jgi:hypothetical protein
MLRIPARCRLVQWGAEAKFDDTDATPWWNPSHRLLRVDGQLPVARGYYAAAAASLTA